MSKFSRKIPVKFPISFLAAALAGFLEPFRRTRKTNFDQFLIVNRNPSPHTTTFAKNLDRHLDMNKVNLDVQSKFIKVSLNFKHTSTCLSTQKKNRCVGYFQLSCLCVSRVFWRLTGPICTWTKLWTLSGSTSGTSMAHVPMRPNKSPPSSTISTAPFNYTGHTL